jgi:hypothetical protein
MLLPPAATESERRLRQLACIAAGAVILELAWLFLAGGAAGRGPQFVLLGTSLALVTLLVLLIRAAARGRASLDRSGFLVCPHCGYPLAGLPSTGLCPECSRGYTASELERLWKDAYSTYEGV